MNDAGYIYVLINPSMNGLTKVGKTSRNPEDRVRELSKVTGIPTPFILAFDVYLDNCSQAEEYVHMVLEQRGYRVASNREFFDAPLNEVIKVVLEAQNIFSGNITSDEMSDYSDLDEDEDCFPNTLQIQAREYWKDVLREAEAYYFGEGDTLQDYSEAVKLFKQAAKLGSVSAYLYLGQMYFKGEGCSKDEKKALEYFKEGAKRGDSRCSAEMGILFAAIGHIDNSQKSWKKYFESEGFLRDVGGWGVLYGYLYFLEMKYYNLPLENVDALRKIKDKLIQEAENRIEAARKEQNPNHFQFLELKYDIINSLK